jgi:hypothetical protein
VEGADGRQGLQEILAELTASAVHVTCRQIDDEPAEKSAATPVGRTKVAAKENVRPVETAEGDEFVQKALGVFEARVLKVTELASKQSEP